MKKYKTINLRKKPSQTPMLIFTVAAMALIAIPFAMGYKDGKLYRKAQFPATKPVVLYQVPQKAKMVLYKPKNEADRLRVIGEIWGVKHPAKALNELKQLARK
jgi:hypothetical protein